ncbi:type I toxin-antitoxin system Ibs family toxin [Klebsiella pneumoniae]|nr:type I toxin-antitoxin system Ibs family toxin [Klebsiella pneumoniae]
MMKHVIILVILLVISFRLTKNTGEGETSPNPHS